MKTQKNVKQIILFIVLNLLLIAGFTFINDPFSNDKVSQMNKRDLKLSKINYTNATIISDGLNGSYWNDANSEDARIIVDNNNVVHVVWQDGTNGIWGSDYEIMYAKYSSTSGWSNAIVISDGYSGDYWNDGYSDYPDIAFDSKNDIHVVWQDDTNGVWGSDNEIMYAKYSSTLGWSNATVISDGYEGSYWNDGNSNFPSIIVDNDDNIHVVWYDYTDGLWGTDTEIMYVNYTEGLGWSNATVISDGYEGSYWNDGGSDFPRMTMENDNLHVVWVDQTEGKWGSDKEIMYVNFNPGSGWSNATIISDGYNNVYWNDGYSNDPSITSKNGVIHVVWEDNTDGMWGVDYEIMYAKYIEGLGWSNATVISDGYDNTYWNDDRNYNPEIIVDYNDNIHVVYEEYIDGIWGTDTEIGYVNYTSENGWSNITIISDGYAGMYWNDQLSSYPALAYGLENVYIVWKDYTEGVWGIDNEIMFTKFSIPPPPSGPGPTITPIPLGNYFLIGLIISITGLIYYVKRRL